MFLYISIFMGKIWFDNKLYQNVWSTLTIKVYAIGWFGREWRW
jgi:hypothetical protein